MQWIDERKAGEKRKKVYMKNICEKNRGILVLINFFLKIGIRLRAG